MTRTSMTPRVTGRRRRSRGITSVEVLVGAMVTVIVMIALMGFFDAQQKAYATMNTYAQSQAVTRTAIDLIARDIRMSSYDPTDLALTTHAGPTCPNVKEGLVTARPNVLRIRQDLDGDGVLLTPGEDVGYVQVEDEIRRNDFTAGFVATTLVEGLPTGGLTFRYFDGATPPNELIPAGTPPSLTQAQRACVEKIQVRIEANIDSPVANRDDLVSVAETGVAIRNRSLTKF